MAEAKLPRNEEERLRALRSYDLLDRDVDPVFDNIIRIAADVCDVDISVIALIDHDRQFFLARNNMKPRETSRVIAFCAHAILEPHTTFEIENATKDPRFKDNPLVTGEIGVRFYAAHPLTTSEGYALGGLCLIGKKPKRLKEFQRNTIRNLANIIMTLFDARKAEMEVTNQSKKTEEALRDSEDLLNSIIENVPVGLLIKSSNHIVERANSTYLRWYGFDEDTMAGRRSDEIENFQSAKEAKFMNAQERKVLKTGRTQTRLVERPFADGKIHTINITKFPVYDQQGKITKVGSVTIDLTDQVQAQRALEHSEMRFRNVINNSPMFISLKDKGGHYLLVNQEHTDLFGFELQDIVGKRVPEVLHQKGAADATAQDRKVIETKAVVVEERPIITNKGTFDFLVTKFPILDGSGAVKEIGTIGIDITERKKLDRMKSEFISTVSHELRTPLTSIKGSLGLVVDGVLGALPEKAKGMVDVAHSNTERLITLVNDILEMETLDSGRMEFDMQPLDLSGLVTEAVVTNKGYAKEHGVKFVLADLAPEVTVRGDGNRLTQVIANLLSNAAKFSPKGGKVEISVGRHNGMARVSVSDHGSGIPEEYGEHIFERFVQADSSDNRQEGGTGLGLSITKSIVEKHGGVIGFDSEVGVGSTFFFTLPV